MQQLCNISVKYGKQVNFKHGSQTLVHLNFMFLITDLQKTNIKVV